MPQFRSIAAGFLISATLCAAAHGQDAPISNRGRKYKAPPPTSHIEVIVLRNYNGKPIANAAVVFHSVKDNKDEGNLEVKTNEDGKAIIDVIPTGSKVGVQVIADGFATYADDYQVDEANRSITVKLLRPRAQVSEYIDNTGKPAQIQPGVQEPHRPSTPPVIQPPQPTNNTSDPAPTAPVDPNATPGNSQNPTPKPN
jgi:hypothetical protein